MMKLLIAFFIVLGLALFALGIWMLVSGIYGVTQDGATAWEIAKIVIGALLLVGGSSSRVTYG